MSVNPREHRVNNYLRDKTVEEKSRVVSEQQVFAPLRSRRKYDSTHSTVYAIYCTQYAHNKVLWLDNMKTINNIFVYCAMLT